MEITNSEFVISNTDVRKCPATAFPEYAFIGRSNVGKSSLINMLTNHKGLAMTSARPGKTMLINHFLINKSWYLVDLPGYGYAKRDQKSQEQIRQIIESYILRREQMTCLFLLIDSRLEPQRIDLEFIEWLEKTAYPLLWSSPKPTSWARATENQRAGLSRKAHRAMGRVTPPLHHLIRRPHRTPRTAGLH